MMIKCKIALIVGAALCLSVMQANMARADFAFEDANNSLNGGAFVTTGLTSPYAYMTVIGDNTTGRVTFNIHSNPLNSSVNVTFNDVAFNTSLKMTTDFTLATTSPAGTNLQLGNSMDGFGKFNFEVDNPADPKNSSDPFIFILQLSSSRWGIGFTNTGLANDFINLQTVGQAGHNDGGDFMYFASHIYATVASGNTGYIGSDLERFNGGGLPPVSTPVPSSITMLASMLVFGLGFFFYRRRNVAVAA